MKRNFIFIYLLFLLLIIPLFVQAQKLPGEDSTIRKNLSTYLRQIQDTGSTACDTLNLKVWNLLTDKTLVNDSDADSVGLYGFRSLTSHCKIYVLMKYYDEYEILAMTDESRFWHENLDYDVVLRNLLSYFSRHPHMDKRLYPTYNKIVYDVYFYNTATDQLGPWHEWYETDQKKYTEGYDINSKPGW